MVYKLVELSGSSQHHAVKWFYNLSTNTFYWWHVDEQGNPHHIEQLDYSEAEDTNLAGCDWTLNDALSSIDNSIPPPGNDHWGHHSEGMKGSSQISGASEKFSNDLPHYVNPHDMPIGFDNPAKSFIYYNGSLFWDPTPNYQSHWTIISLMEKQGISEADAIMNGLQGRYWANRGVYTLFDTVPSPEEDQEIGRALIQSHHGSSHQKEAVTLKQQTNNQYTIFSDDHSGFLAFKVKPLSEFTNPNSGPYLFPAPVGDGPVIYVAMWQSKNPMQGMQMILALRQFAEQHHLPIYADFLDSQLKAAFDSAIYAQPKQAADEDAEKEKESWPETTFYCPRCKEGPYKWVPLLIHLQDVHGEDWSDALSKESGWSDSTMYRWIYNPKTDQVILSNNEFEGHFNLAGKAGIDTSNTYDWWGGWCSDRGIDISYAPTANNEILKKLWPHVRDRVYEELEGDKYYYAQHMPRALSVQKHAWACQKLIVKRDGEIFTGELHEEHYDIASYNNVDFDDEAAGGFSNTYLEDGKHGVLLYGADKQADENWRFYLERACGEFDEQYGQWIPSTGGQGYLFDAYAKEATVKEAAPIWYNWIYSDYHHKVFICPNGRITHYQLAMQNGVPFMNKDGWCGGFYNPKTDELKVAYDPENGLVEQKLPEIRQELQQLTGKKQEGLAINSAVAYNDPMTPKKFVWIDGHILLGPAYQKDYHHYQIAQELMERENLLGANNYIAGTYSIDPQHGYPHLDIEWEKGLVPSQDQLIAEIQAQA